MTVTVPETRLFGSNPNPETERVTGPVDTVKLVVLVAVPPASTTVIVPVVAPDGTVAVIRVAVATGETAATPLNFTDVTVTKPVPVMTTLVPSRGRSSG